MLLVPLFFIKTEWKNEMTKGQVESKKIETWVIDSGASDYMTYDKNNVTIIRETQKTEIKNVNNFVHLVTQSRMY
jgi:hypothetical protein